ncbi:hypothetical protein acsn021_38580 [Anaerocolumna cellulosilytica]|uniref:Probable membrane transporter protein n=1 Tax=Anaerocolumna cellulosilytica TaxID=433286 RepID=A0A6S6R4L8_9FIRM|nr:sulfite exporter TauE/SafE family protein [Anaerocolumna cellulosilytica]MBB5196260.1 hypothetical protein [Anaerocolumna cellulosilytica]BCJ96289.1 hypothetical protein acsn021_38580 [Anaerocolumna cellulosilytica]
MYLIFFLICFIASVLGAICGIGGGIIIKPVLDAFGVISVTTISFLSGCTVLSMAGYTFIRSRLEGVSDINVKTGTPLAIGAAFGGIAGKELFESLVSICTDKNMIGAIQAVCLFIITIGTLVYSLHKARINTYQMTSPIMCLLLGSILGMLSSFLGIGGGPVNLVVLYYFFSMSTKVAAENSLYIILFSQITSLISTVLSGNIPNFPLVLLVLMIAAGIAGGVCGRNLNKKINDKLIDKLCVYMMIFLIGINLYNIWKYLQ